jgi:phytoene synthase
MVEGLPEKGLPEKGLPETGSPEEGLQAWVRRADPDRHLCALFAPPDRREALFTLYAFNHELARACEVAREPGLALIRLQWWREVVEGAQRAHPVAGPLLARIASGELAAGDLLSMIEARERESEGGFEDTADWIGWLHAGAGTLMASAARVLGADKAALEPARELGAGCGAVGQWRNWPALAAYGRCLLPADLLGRAGLSADAMLASPEPAGLSKAGDEVARLAGGLLGRARSRERGWIAALLPAVLARRDLARFGHAPRPRGVTDRLAVVSAYVRGAC